MTSRLHATVDGPADAPVLVLGSSLGTTGAMWGPQLAALTEEFRVIRYDHPGHGGSTASPGPYTIAGLGRAVLRLLDELGVPRAHYAGLSLGGMVGMWLAAYAPERVQRLVLLCTSAALGPAQGWRDRATTVRAHRTAAVADAVLARWFTPDFALTRPDTVRTYRAMLASVTAEGYAGCCEAIAAMDLREELTRITAPTLVVAGAADPATPVGHAREIVERIPHARLEVVDRAAHLASVEQPEQITRLMREHVGAAQSGER